MEQGVTVNLKRAITIDCLRFDPKKMGEHGYSIGPRDTQTLKTRTITGKFIRTETGGAIHVEVAAVLREWSDGSTDYVPPIGSLTIRIPAANIDAIQTPN